MAHDRKAVSFAPGDPVVFSSSPRPVFIVRAIRGNFCQLESLGRKTHEQVPCKNLVPAKIEHYLLYVDMCRGRNSSREWALHTYIFEDIADKQILAHRKNFLKERNNICHPGTDAMAKKLGRNPPPQWHQYSLRDLKKWSAAEEARESGWLPSMELQKAFEQSYPGFDGDLEDFFASRLEIVFDPVSQMFYYPPTPSPSDHDFVLWLQNGNSAMFAMMRKFLLSSDASAFILTGSF